MALNTKLPAFLRHAALKEKRAGAFDCGLWLGDWLMLATGCSDPWAGIRGSYSNFVECDDLYGRQAVLRQAVKRFAYLPATNDPLPGDIAVLALRDVSGVRTAVGAIRSARGWMLLSPSGVSCVPSAKVLRAWRVEEV